MLSSIQWPTRSSPAIGYEVWEAADVFVVSRFQPIAPNHLHGALVTTVGQEPKEQARGMIIAFARALVERAADWQFDVPAPGEYWICGKINIYVAKQHRPAVVGFEPHPWNPVLHG